MSARKIAYNTIAQVAGKFLGFFISSFFLIILAGKLGTTGMGMYTTVTAFVAFFVNIADLGLSIVMMREIAQNPEQREAITGEFYGFRLVYSLLIMLLGPLVALLVPQYSHQIIIGVAIAAVAQFILLVNQTFVSVLQVGLQLDRAVLAEIINRVVTLALVVYGARISGDSTHFFYFVLWVTVMAAIVNAALSYFFAQKLWAIRPRFDLKKWRQTLTLVIPMGVFSFLSMVHFKSDTIILSLLKPSYDVGIYGYAYKIGEIMFSIPMLFIGIVFPRMSALYKADRPEFLAFTQKVFDVLLFIATPFIAGIFILAPYLTTLLSRQSASDGLLAGHVLQILSFAMIAWFFGALFQHILLAGTSYTGLIRNLGIAVLINLALNFWLIPHYSYYAAATTTDITEALMLILTVAYVARVTTFMPKLTGAWSVILATLGMTAAVWLLQRWLASDILAFAAAGRIHQMTILLIFGSVGAIVYLGILSLWGKRSPALVFLRMLQK